MYALTQLGKYRKQQKQISKFSWPFPRMTDSHDANARAMEDGGHTGHVT